MESRMRLNTEIATSALTRFADTARPIFEQHGKWGGGRLGGFGCVCWFVCQLGIPS